MTSIITWPLIKSDADSGQLLSPVQVRFHIPHQHAVTLEIASRTPRQLGVLLHAGHPSFRVAVQLAITRTYIIRAARSTAVVLLYWAVGVQQAVALLGQWMWKLVSL